MYTIREFTVMRTLPDRLLPLKELAMNFWWTWNPEAQELFRRLDPVKWTSLNQNPIEMLNSLDSAFLAERAEDKAFLAHLDQVVSNQREELSQPTWFDNNFSAHKDRIVAYFSAEFGLHESLPTYSGGLGVLAGDHLKAASQLGVPMVGVSLLYRYGYFHQHLSNEGWQFEEYPPVDPPNMAITAVNDRNGKPIKIHVEMADRLVAAQIWRVDVGRIRLFLLDTFLQENRQEDREITGRLYGGDQDMRIRQEIVLGIGGVRALQAAGIEPSVCHMNEGHCAFLALERVRQLVQKKGLAFDDAKEAVAGTTLFTTHTPLPAGIDTFPTELVHRYLDPYAKDMKLTEQKVVALGQLDTSNDHEPFSMAILAIRLASGCNGVSKLHASVAQNMWHPLWKNLPVHEVPISAITNGVHVCTWQSEEIARLYDRYLGPGWHEEDPKNNAVWDRVDEIPDSELWRAHERLREQLVVGTRDWLKQQMKRRGAPSAELEAAEGVLDPDALTIGFARRFATYKRAALFLTDQNRIRQILTDPKRPVQIIISGKAHPRDDVGKELIKRIFQFAKDPAIRPRFVFLEDYSMCIARLLVRGVDVWLNNPIKMLEASGTSGMKVACNGGLNFSILDGWWPEGYDGTNGFAIGDEHVYDNDQYRDRLESESLYEMLEREVVPMFYDRGPDGVPKKWVGRMKSALKKLTPGFSARRMVRQYIKRHYAPAAARSQHLWADDFRAAKDLAAWKKRMHEYWPKVKVDEVVADDGMAKPVGESLEVKAKICLGEIAPSDVAVELYHGPVNGTNTIKEGRVAEMRNVGTAKGHRGLYEYVGSIRCTETGRHGFAIRVIPHHENLNSRHAMGLVSWG